MKTHLLAFFLLTALFFSCEKEESELPDPGGVWVEKSEQLDTIVFNDPEYDFSFDWFDLRRDEMLSSGPYEYILQDDSIRIHWMLSSCTCWNSYYFELDGQGKEFTIGNFYDTDNPAHENLVFMKISDISGK